MGRVRMRDKHVGAGLAPAPTCLSNNEIMKILIRTFMVVLFVPQVVSAQSKPFTKSKIQWVTTNNFEFGEVPHNKDTSFIFVFRNIDSIPITLDNVRTDCSCTALEWLTEPIAPQKTGSIKLIYHAPKVGYFRKKMSVWIHKQKKPEYIYISGEVISN